MPATMKALSYPGLLTTSDTAAFLANWGISVPKNIKDAAAAAQQLKATLTGLSLSEIKNPKKSARIRPRSALPLRPASTRTLGEDGVRQVLEGMAAKLQTAPRKRFCGCW